MNTLSALQQEHLKAAIQDGLPISRTPYADLAHTIGSHEDDVLHQLQTWVQQGFIKRMGLVVRHQAVGYNANAMVVWDIPDEQADAIGERLRSLPMVTLCYRRARQLPDWPYNLYCMIHGKSRPVVLDQIQHLRQQCGIEHFPHTVLFSHQQFKQTGGHYARIAG